MFRRRSCDVENVNIELHEGAHVRGLKAAPAPDGRPDADRLTVPEPVSDPG